MNKTARFFVKVLLVFLTYHLSPIALSAQTFTQRVQQGTIGGARVIIHQDVTIEELVNGLLTGTSIHQRQNVEQPRTNRQQTERHQRNDNEHETAREGENPTNNQIDSLTLTPQRTHKVMGYRIQVFVGGKTRADKQKAESTASAIKTMFPNHKVYVHFYSPRWICRMGNFRTLAEAKEVLDEVVRMGYDTATLVRGRVTVPY